MNKKNYYIIGSLLSVYGKNQYIDLCICLIISIFLIKNINKNDFYYLYFGLVFFEPILNLPFVGGSMFRIYQIIFLIKILLDIKNGNSRLYVKNISSICGIILIITGFIYQNFISNFSIIINVILILYAIYKNNDSDKFYKELLYVVGIMIFYTAIYGFFKGNELNYGSFVRKTTTISDPNYSALFLSIGIFSVLNNAIFTNKEKIIVLLTLVVSLILTVSLTGIIGTTILFLIYLSIKNLKKNFKYLIFILILFLIFLNIPLKSSNILYGIQSRILNIEGSSINDISSGRFEIGNLYIQQFKDLPILEILFGGNNTIDGEFRDYCVKKFGLVSHNSFIDMLYMTGIVGTIAILITFIYEINYCYKQYKKNKNIAINYMFIKIIILYYSLTLSSFPYRYFIVFYLLNINSKRGDLL